MNCNIPYSHLVFWKTNQNHQQKDKTSMSNPVKANGPQELYISSLDFWWPFDTATCFCCMFHYFEMRFTTNRWTLHHTFQGVGHSEQTRALAAELLLHIQVRWLAVFSGKFSHSLNLTFSPLSRLVVESGHTFPVKKVDIFSEVFRHDWPGDMEHVLEARQRTKKTQFFGQRNCEAIHDKAYRLVYCI